MKPTLATAAVASTVLAIVLSSVTVQAAQPFGRDSVYAGPGPVPAAAMRPVTVAQIHGRDSVYLAPGARLSGVGTELAAHVQGRDGVRASPQHAPGTATAGLARRQVL